MRKKTNAKFTRRDFIAAVSSAAAVSIFPGRALAQVDALELRLAADPMRPQFHLLPAANWMNDPNGPIYFNGKYHMFFQYNPHAAVWGDMSWYHSVSVDMVHWRHLPLAFVPTAGGPDAAGCFTGSAIAVGGRVYVVYTGVVNASTGNGLVESQCLAFSDDEELLRWTKAPAPIVADPPLGMKPTGFRDPSVWKQGDGYYMTVGSGVAKVGGCVLLYHSADLKSWTYLHKLVSGETGDAGDMWECPEFFSLDGAHVLIYSTAGKAFWQSGVLDDEAMVFHPMKKGVIDLGAFYAPKTQLDASGRRILWGWIQERRPEAEFRAAGWAGVMSLPRVLRLDRDGTLRMEFLPELSVLRVRKLPSLEARSGQYRKIAKATGEAICSMPEDADFNFRIAVADKEILRVEYSAAKRVFAIEGKEIALQPNDRPMIHAYFDGSVIELMMSDRMGYTERFYFAGATAPDIDVTADGMAKLDAWNIRPISKNRLTTPA